MIMTSLRINVFKKNSNIYIFISISYLILLNVNNGSRSGKNYREVTNLLISEIITL